MNAFTLREFVTESNRIEGIYRKVRDAELTAHEKVLDAPVVTVNVLREFVATVQPGAVLREHEGLNVRVGRHVAPQGGEDIRRQLSELLLDVRRSPLIVSPMEIEEAFGVHVSYEHLHPFTDGNGRSGRALWLWQMGGIDRAPLGFLHHFYYQTLQAGQR